MELNNNLIYAEHCIYSWAPLEELNMLDSSK